MSPGNIGGEAKQFLVWHGEKFVVAVIGIFALWLAMQGLGYQSLSWQPSELGQVASEAEQAIKASTRTAGDEDLTIFDYAEHAKQIKEPIPVAPYRNPLGSEWNPPLEPQSATPPPKPLNQPGGTDEPLSEESDESEESELSQDVIQ